MLKRLMRLSGGRGHREPDAPPPWPVETLAPGRTIYAVGDIHGRADLLGDLLARLLETDEPQGEPLFLFLGDYVDRGDDSRGVLDLLAALAEEPTLDTVFLTGNHESMMLGFLADPEREARWLRFGGLATLMSYGVMAYETTSPGDLIRIRDELAEALEPHRSLLEGLRLWHRSGNVLFAHAGADPARPVEDQPRQTLVWGERDNLRDVRADGLWVVHGHWRVAAPTIEGGRIAIDTGAYDTGRLTAVRLAPGEMRFLWTDP